MLKVELRVLHPAKLSVGLLVLLSFLIDLHE